MADVNVERRYRGPRMTAGWIGLGILLLAVLIWIIYAFFAIGTGPEPPPVDFERTRTGDAPPAERVAPPEFPTPPAATTLAGEGTPAQPQPGS
jgi:hypothetical protein